jgi:hypothetical protein
MPRANSPDGCDAPPLVMAGGRRRWAVQRDERECMRVALDSTRETGRRRWTERGFNATGQYRKAEDLSEERCGPLSRQYVAGGDESRLLAMHAHRPTPWLFNARFVLFFVRALLIIHSYIFILGHAVRDVETGRSHSVPHVSCNFCSLKCTLPRG